MQYGGVRAVKHLELQDLIEQANAFLKNNHSSIGKSGKVRGEIGTLRKIISRQTKDVEVDDSTPIYLTSYFLNGKLAKVKEIIAKGGDTNMCEAMKKLIEKYGRDDVEIAMMAVGCNVERVSLYIRTQMSAEG